MVKLSENFSREEFEIDGSPMPNQGVLEAYTSLCRDILEPLRAWAGEPFHITSGYRSPQVNDRIGGARSSQHVATIDECAADGYFASYRKSMLPVFDWVRVVSSLPFDQVILEHGKNGDIIHISWSKSPRRVALEGATFNQTTYTAHYVAPIHKENA